MSARLLPAVFPHFRLLLWCAALTVLSLLTTRPAHAAWVASPWAPSAQEVHALARHTNGSGAGVLIAGNAFSGGGVTGRGLVRVNAATLAQDTSFTPDITLGTGASATSGEVYAIAVESNGSVVIAGRFDHVNGVARGGMARLLANGTLDAGYNPSVTDGLHGGVLAMAVQADDSVVIAGGFSHVNGTARRYLARLDGAGGLDASFADPAFDNSVTALALQSDGAVIVGGHFNNAHGAAHEGVVRLLGTGLLDASFSNPAISGPVSAVYIQPNGQILVGGSLGSIGGQPRNGMARLNSDGALDATFTVDTDGGHSVKAFARASGSKVVIAGTFTEVNGTPMQRVARIDTGTPPGGPAVPATLDLTLTDVAVSHAGYLVNAVLPLSDTDVLIGGSFARVDQQYRTSLAQIMDRAGVPLAPAIAQAQPRDSAAVLTIAASADPLSPPATSFSVICTPQANLPTVTATGASPLTVAGLVNGTAYDCVARANNGAGSGPASAVVRIVPTAAAGPVAVPTLSALPLMLLALLAAACAAPAWARRNG